MSIWSGVPFGASRTDAGARQTGAMQNHHIPTPDTGRRVRAPETWDAARAAYLDGESARDVCARLAEQARADQRAETAARTAGHKGAVQRIRAIGHAARDAQREAVRSERELPRIAPIAPCTSGSGAARPRFPRSTPLPRRPPPPPEAQTQAMRPGIRAWGAGRPGLRTSDTARPKPYPATLSAEVSSGEDVPTVDWS